MHLKTKHHHRGRVLGLLVLALWCPRAPGMGSFWGPKEPAVFHSPLTGHALRTITAKEVAAFKQTPCTLVHVWAIYCTICIEEMPQLLTYFDSKLRSQDPFSVAIIDVSGVSQQESFSRKFISDLHPSFPTYQKGVGKMTAFIDAIDPNWQGDLPYTALYHGGKQAQVWTGELDLKKIDSQIDATCKTP